MATSEVFDALNEKERVREISQSANKYSSDFVNLFYKSLDNKRHELSKYYADEAKYIWNGNEFSDSTNRQKFQSELPDSTHTIECFDAQPIFNEFNNSDHYMILLSVSGTVRYRGNGLKLFYENFILKVFDNTNWKIISDCFRFAE